MTNPWAFLPDCESYSNGSTLIIYASETEIVAEFQEVSVIESL